MKSKKLLIVALIVIILGLVGFICYEKDVFKKDKPEDESAVEERTMEEKEALALLERFDINTGTVGGYNELNQIFAVIENNLANVKCDPGTKCQSFETHTCKELLDTEFDKWKDDGGGYMYSESNTSAPYYCGSDLYPVYPFDTVNAKFKSMFGKEIEKKNYYPYYYLKKYDGFVSLLYGDGTTGPNVDIVKLKSATIKDDLLTITVYMENIGISEEDNIGKNFVDNESDYDEDDMAKIEKEIYDKYLDEVDCYDITFDVDGNNYVFNKIKQV